MTAYVVFDVNIRDGARFQDFMKGVKPEVEAAGGKYLARGGAFKVYEGDWKPDRLVLFSFPSLQAFQDFYDSPRYRELKAIRDECSTARLVAFEGID